MTINVTPTSTTTYTLVSLSDANCTSTDSDLTGSVEITVNPKPEIAINTANATVCPDGTVDLEAELTAEGTADYIYTWTATDGMTLLTTTETTDQTTITNTATAPAASPSTCGATYSIGLSVEDANGCTATASPITVTVNDDTDPTIGTDDLDRELVSTNCVFTVPDLTEEVRVIALDNCTANVDLTITQDHAVGEEITAATTVTVTVTDQCGNSSTKEIELTLPQTLESNVSVTDALCLGSGDGTATANVSGGTAPYTYEWDDAANSDTETIDHLAAGTYTVTVTDANGCSIAASGEVGQPANALTASIDGRTEVCNNTTATLTVTAAGGTPTYTYEWDDDDTNPTTDESITTPVLNGDNTPFTYAVIVTDAHGCTFQTSHTVTIGDTPSLSLSSDAPICDGATATLTATVSNAGSSYTIEWTSNDSGAGLDVTNTDEITVTPASDGTYTYTATLTTDACNTGTDYVVTEDIEITVNPIPAVAITNNTGTNLLTCAVTEISLTAEGSGDFEWSDGLGSDADQIISTPGPYTVIITDANGCTNSASKTIDQSNENPTVTLVENAITICAGGSTTIAVDEVTGGVPAYLYSWNDGAFGGITEYPLSNVSTPTTVTLTVKDENGCTGTASAEISINDRPTAEISGGEAICNGESASFTITFTGAPDYSYTWSDGTDMHDGSTNESSVTITVTPTATTTYTLVSLSDDNCTSTDSDLTGSVEVIVNEIPYATAVTTDNEMCVAPFSGTITVSTFGPEDTDYTVTLDATTSQTA